MAHEDPSPAIHNQVPGYPEGLPQPGYFDVAAMPDDKLVDLGRALYVAESQVLGAETMRDHLGADIAVLTASEPERGKALLDRLAHSDDPSERYIAVSTAIPLAFVDYEFTREMLFAVERIDQRQGDHTGVMPWVNNLADILRQNGREDQADDLLERWTALEEEHGYY